MSDPTFLYKPELRVIATPEIIEKHNFVLRSQEQIAEEFKKVRESDLMFDFRSEVLFPYLTFENLKPYLKEEYVAMVESGEKTHDFVNNIEDCAQDFYDYMNFAWGKAVNRRGLSAGRSIEKLSTYLWLLSREDLVSIIESDDLYTPYGAPALLEVCKKLEITVPEELTTFINTH